MTYLHYKRRDVSFVMTTLYLRIQLSIIYFIQKVFDTRFHKW